MSFCFLIRLEIYVILLLLKLEIYVILLLLEFDIYVILLLLKSGGTKQLVRCVLTGNCAQLDRYMWFQVGRGDSEPTTSCNNICGQLVQGAGELKHTVCETAVQVG